MRPEIVVIIGLSVCLVMQTIRVWLWARWAKQMVTFAREASDGWKSSNELAAKIAEARISQESWPEIVEAKQ